MGPLLLFTHQFSRKSAFRVGRAGALILFALFISACGVKGDPLPPKEPPYIGSGEPNFKGGISNQPIEEEDYEEDESYLEEEEPY